MVVAWSAFVWCWCVVLLLLLLLLLLPLPLPFVLRLSPLSLRCILGGRASRTAGRERPAISRDPQGRQPDESVQPIWRREEAWWRG